jgi:ComF family protein
LKWRGFNQAELLARFTAKQLNYPVLPLLKRLRHTTPQALLKETARRANLKDAFVLAESSSPLPETVILVDDVASTGSTLEECAQVLKKSGVKNVWGLVVARG